MAQTYLNHYSIRIADPKRSLEFYEKNFGMTLLRESTDGDVTRYLLGLTEPNSLFKNAPYYKRSGLLELTHAKNATIDNFVANSGNKDPHRGFGHISFSVSELISACDKLEANGVKFQKKPSDGRQHYIAFALDPDGYWIELIINGCEEPTTRLNHAMMRVKNREKSLDFFTNKLGMTVVDISDHPNGKFTNYFLSFDPEGVKSTSRQLTEGLIELTYNWGTETEDAFKYNNGNEDPVGFNHFGVAVPNPAEFVAELQAKGVKLLETGSSNTYTILDPDNYYFKIVPQSEFE